MEQKQQHARIFRKRRRVINKFGEKNITLAKLPQQSRRFIVDFVTTIIETRWRTVVSAYLCAAFGCWIFFAFLWYLIAYAHNDLAINSETGIPMHDDNRTCLKGVQTLTALFLLSFEIQTTVGFGERYPYEDCPEAVFMFMAQIIIGRIIDGTMVGIIYAKLTKSPRKPYHLKFSRKAVICYRDSSLCLMFRLCDPNEIHIIGSKVQACLIGEFGSTNADRLDPFQQPLKVEGDGNVLVIFPLVVCHVIDCNSPLYKLSAKLFLEKRFEILVSFTGASPSTGQTSEERTSYLSEEILWGHRFVNMVEYNTKNRNYFIDYDRFEVTEEVETLLCSAHRFDQIRQKISNNCFDLSAKSSTNDSNDILSTEDT